MMWTSRSLSFIILLCSQVIHPVRCLEIHLPLLRRNGRFARHHNANLTFLSETLAEAESRYASTYRDIEDNRLVRRWQVRDDFLDEDALLWHMEQRGPWYAFIKVGEPHQTLEFDLNMLSPDLYTLMTTSEHGSRYNTFISASHGHSDARIHPLCRNPTDVFHLDPNFAPPRLVLPICNALKPSRQTLLPSGSIIGLAPNSPLTRLPNSNILAQLKKDNHIWEEVWSITLLDSDTGILSIGTTVAKEIERAKVQGDLELQHLGDPIASETWKQQEVDRRLSTSLLDQLPMETHFKWTSTQSAAGWWTALMAGVWVNGAKVLKNQPVLFDVQCPYILAPPAAAARFYEAIGGVIRLTAPYNGFFAFPCLNQVNVAFELGGWNFPSMYGEGTRADSLYGPAGGRFSLGKIADGTGYCLGTVVETKMGRRRAWQSSGMQDVWVLGEPFFRGLGVIFDVGRSRIGIRTY